MAPSLWPAKTSRYDWIKARSHDFQDALAKGPIDPWINNMIRDYFNTYHWSLPDDVEPSHGAVYAEPVDSKGKEDKNTIIKKKKEASVQGTQGVC
jgi:hypothetical protein